MTHEFSETAGPAAPPTKMSLWTKLAYGAGDMGAGMTSNLIAFSFLIFLTEVAGIRPAAAGTVLLISKVWDAVNDPLVGVLSDRTQTRWGRRYPWILLSALPFGFTFFSHVVGAGGAVPAFGSGITWAPQCCSRSSLRPPTCPMPP